ncbi:alginate O-acetyltransferase AlgX-related protein [Methylocystis sp. JAN1]|uniref:alginate O-acetyltransferase AlgX-related protein n=1 Tax=Methylocystis sp. JAN1 TaxID=3397211 RepID=UPI003FA1D296
MSFAPAGSLLDVIEGGDNWLFLRRYENLHVLDLQTDLSSWSQTHLPILTAQFAGRHAKLAARGISYVVAIAPEKSSIYPEKLPSEYRLASPTLAELLTTACRQAGVEAVDLTSALRLAKGAMDLYFRVDSHWTYYGAYIAYRSIIEAIQKRVDVSVVQPHQILYHDKEGFGDLGVHMRPERRGLLQQVTLSSEVEAQIKAYDDRERAYASYTCQDGRSKAVILRDSFATFMSPYLARSFSTSTFVSPPLALHEDMIEDLEPDVVIHLYSERALLYYPEGLADWDARSWRQTYLEAYENPQWANLIRPLRRSLIEKRFDESVKLGQQLSDAGGWALEHNLAEALIGARLYEKAIEACDRMELRGNATAFSYFLKAYGQRALGRGEAVATLREALRTRPQHARFLYELGLWLAQDGDLPEAAAALHAALESAPGFLQGWSELSRVNAEMGDKSAAEIRGSRQ